MGSAPWQISKYFFISSRSLIILLISVSAAKFLAAITSPSVFLSILLQSAGANEFSSSGRYSPLSNRYFFVRFISVSINSDLSSWTITPTGLFMIIIFSSSYTAFIEPFARIKSCFVSFLIRNSSLIYSFKTSPSDKMYSGGTFLSETLIRFLRK